MPMAFARCNGPPQKTEWTEIMRLQDYAMSVCRGFFGEEIERIPAPLSYGTPTRKDKNRAWIFVGVVVIACFAIAAITS
jgi:hypothetical protein